MKRALCMPLLSAGLLLSGQARCEPPVWKFDPPHCGFFFDSEEIRALGGDRYEADGMFRIKDVSREITVPFAFHGVTPGPMREITLVAGFDARFTIDRLAYNVGTGKFYNMGVTGKTVEIILSIEMIRESE